MESVGVRELRQHASRWLARVAAGESFTITDRGRAVASLTPVAASGWEQLVAAGSVTPPTARLGGVAPVEVGSADAGPSLSELLADDRDASW